MTPSIAQLYCIGYPRDKWPPSVQKKLVVQEAVELCKWEMSELDHLLEEANKAKEAEKKRRERGSLDLSKAKELTAEGIWL
jgi:hypothetical protein